MRHFCDDAICPDPFWKLSISAKPRPIRAPRPDSRTCRPLARKQKETSECHHPPKGDPKRGIRKIIYV